MVASGLIFAFVALVLITGTTLLSPCCTPVVALLLGLICGFLAPHFEKSAEKSPAVRRATYAGGIAGVGAVLGQVIGAVINTNLVGPEKAASMMQSWGLPIEPGFESGYWGGMIFITACVSLLNVLLMAGTGALGGLLWWQWVGAKRTGQTSSSVG